MFSVNNHIGYNGLWQWRGNIFTPAGEKYFILSVFILLPIPFSEFDADINIKTMHTRQTTRRILDSNKTIAFNTFNVIICILNIP